MLRPKCAVCAAWAIAGILVGGCGSGARIDSESMTRSIRAPSSSTRPEYSAASATAETVALLERLLEDGRLRYSNDADDAAKQFHFVTRVARTLPSGERSVVELTVSRDEGGVRIVCAQPNGLPYAYLASGLFVALDPERPGGLVVRNTGAPTFLLRADPQQHRLNFGLAYAAKQREPYVLLDLASVLRSTLAKMREGRIDHQSATVHVKAEHSVMTVFLGDQTTPVAGLIATSDDGATSVHVTRIGLGRAAWPTPLTVNAVVKLGLPLRRAAANDKDPLDLLRAPDVAQDAAMKATAEKLQRELLQPREAVPEEEKPKRIEPRPVPAHQPV